MSESTAVATVLVLGFVAGVLSGMFGIGGGLVIVPALVILFGMEIKTATGTSLFALMWPVGLLGVIEYWRNGRLDVRSGFLLTVGLFFGAYLGARVTMAISPATMKRLYALFLLAVGTYFLLTVKSEPAPKPDAIPAADQVH